MPLWGKTDSTSSLPKSKTKGATDNVLFEDMASVYADARPGTADATRLGWYFTNTVKGNKVNWYFFSKDEASVNLSDIGVYAVVTLDSTASTPFLAIYTIKEGAGDASSWYRSRVVSAMPAGSVIGTKYLLCYGSVPEHVYPNLPRVNLVNTFSTVGPRGATEKLLTIAVGSDSGASAGNVKFVCEASGIVSPDYSKNTIYRIRSTYSPQVEIASGAVADSGVVPKEVANIYLVDTSEAPLAKTKGISGPGWWNYTTYTTSTGKVRNKAECLVPMKLTREQAGDSARDDIILPNGEVVITQQPANASAANGANVSFSVTGNANGAAISYQWQESSNGTTFTNISGATAATYTFAAATLKNGYKYRVVLSSKGLVSATSNAATLTVT